MKASSVIRYGLMLSVSIRNMWLERGHQVATMGTIFRSAETALAWTRKSARSSHRVFDFASRHSSPEISDSSDQNSPTETQRKQSADIGIEDVESLYAFSIRPYWDRTWIIQELALARQAIVACGSHRWSLLTLRILLKSSHDRVKEGYQPSPQSQRRYHTTYATTTIESIMESPMLIITAAATSSLQHPLNRRCARGSDWQGCGTTKAMFWTRGPI